MHPLIQALQTDSHRDIQVVVIEQPTKMFVGSIVLMQNGRVETQLLTGEYHWPTAREAQDVMNSTLGWAHQLANHLST